MNFVRLLDLAVCILVMQRPGVTHNALYPLDATFRDNKSALYRKNILVGVFHYRTWLVHSNDGLPQISLGLREQASLMHTHLVFFFELS